MLREDADPDALGANRAIFRRIVLHYDILNRLISLGRDVSWRREAVKALSLSNSAEVLDLATGTAEMALAICRVHPQSTVIGLDVSPEMLGLGEAKVSRARLDGRIILREGNAVSLEFAEASFDGAVCAFALRNMPRRKLMFHEARRVLRPNGKLVVLEVTMPGSGAFRPIVDLYLRGVVPLIGGIVSQRAAYRYLGDSIRRFVEPDEVCLELRDAGFRAVTFRRLTGGAATLFVACAAGSERA